MGNIWEYDCQNAWDYENGFYLTSPSSRLAKAIAHWELYRKIVDLPGEVVECGVFKGASIIRFATFREILESQESRKILGFDAFGSFPPATEQWDRDFIDHFEGAAGAGIPFEEMNRCFERKGFSNYEFIKGDICETVPRYVAEHRELKIALLHIDVDVFEPAKAALEHLFDCVVPGGVIALDDYGTVYGETKAFDDFMKARGGNFRLHKSPYYKIPTYMIKES